MVAEHLLNGEPIEPIVGAKAKEFGWERLHDAYAAALRIRGKGWPAEVFPDA